MAPNPLHERMAERRAKAETLFNLCLDMCEKKYGYLYKNGTDEEIAAEIVSRCLEIAAGVRERKSSLGAQESMWLTELTEHYQRALEAYDEWSEYMKSFNWQDINISDGQGRLEPGAYVARITSIKDVPEREYVFATWDIAEGPHTGHYNGQWGNEHPYAHCLYLSYKESAAGMLKGRLEKFRDSNPGFDPFVCWDSNVLDPFLGRIFGVVLQEEEYALDGEIKTRLNVADVVTVQDVRDGKVRPRSIKKLNQDEAPAQTAAPAPVPAPSWSVQQQPAMPSESIAYAQQAEIPFS